MTAAHDRSTVLAVLGPTNTGKTHLAIDRMLSHASGIIGFPLRLLARENYDRIVTLKGRGRVALVTGEEKIVPPNADYFVCTVESMPLDRRVAFQAIDEIQLCADLERGHVFTHRLLHCRGSEETMLLGAETIKPLIRRLVPEARFISRPRFSTLSYAGPRKLTRLPPRSAVVAFSATDVYRHAELLRRQRGGTAVVLGALSPRTRNAQVAMYQAGEVDYLVATDAIGMGLNMDIDHVAFAQLSKFDGRSPRRLRATEIAQIAGRAGRHMSDGTFGTTHEAGTLDPEIVEAVETHRFEPLKTLTWRNPELDYRSPPLLLKSLERPPPTRELRRAPDCDDQLTLAALARDPDILARCDSRARTRLLWEVCQVPDFRKVLSDAHTRMLAEVFRQLTGPHERLDGDWVARQVARLDRTEGDIDTLVTRIAHIRTWTYLSHRQDWMPDPRHWQERAGAIEDKLSDALHERLTQRFVDRRSAVLARSMTKGADLMSAVTRAGEVLVEGEYVGELHGFRFVADQSTHSEDARALMSAARRALRREIDARVRRLEAEGDEAFSLGEDGSVLWHGHAVGALAAGPEILRPEIRLLPSDLLEPTGRDRVLARLRAWLHHEIAQALKPLTRLKEAPLTGAARGIAYQLVEGLGGVERAGVATLIDHLGKTDRAALRQHGVRLGHLHVYLTRALKPRPVAMRALLWAVARRLPLPAPLPPAGSPSIPCDPALPPTYYAAIGYAPCGGRAVRHDRLDALAGMAGAAARAGGFAPTPAMAQLIGCPMKDLGPVLLGLGFRDATGDDGVLVFRRKGGAGRPARARGRHKGARADEASPFAKLRTLGGAG